MSESPKVRHANGAKLDEVEASADLRIATGTDGNGNTVVRFSEPVSVLRLPRLQLAQFIAALAKEAKMKVEISL